MTTIAEQKAAILAAAMRQPRKPERPAHDCQCCGVHHPDLVINEHKRCAVCEAEWTSLEAIPGMSGRMVLEAFNARAGERRIESKRRMAELYRSEVAA